MESLKVTFYFYHTFICVHLCHVTKLLFTLNFHGRPSPIERQCSPFLSNFRENTGERLYTHRNHGGVRERGVSGRHDGQDASACESMGREMVTDEPRKGYGGTRDTGSVPLLRLSLLTQP